MNKPITLPAPIRATVKPQPSPAEMMRRLEERYLWPDLFKRPEQKTVDVDQLIVKY